MTQICDNAFDGCSLLKEITFAKESRLKRIGAYAFLDSSIEAFLAPSALKEIGVMAFCKCYELSFVQLNDGLESIGELAFWGAKIKNLKLPRQCRLDQCKLGVNYEHIKTLYLPDTIEEITKE